MDDKINQALAALVNLKTSNEVEDKMLQIARGALVALKKYGTGNAEEALAVIADISRTSDEVGLEITRDLVGDDYGPLQVSPSKFLYN